MLAAYRPTAATARARHSQLPSYQAHLEQLQHGLCVLLAHSSAVCENAIGNKQLAAGTALPGDPAAESRQLIGQLLNINAVSLVRCQQPQQSAFILVKQVVELLLTVAA